MLLCTSNFFYVIVCCCAAAAALSLSCFLLYCAVNGGTIVSFKFGFCPNLDLDVCRLHPNPDFLDLDGVMIHPKVNIFKFGLCFIVVRIICIWTSKYYRFVSLLVIYLVLATDEK